MMKRVSKESFINWNKNILEYKQLAVSTQKIYKIVKIRQITDDLMDSYLNLKKLENVKFDLRLTSQDDYICFYKFIKKVKENRLKINFSRACFENIMKYIFLYDDIIRLLLSIGVNKQFFSGTLYSIKPPKHMSIEKLSIRYVDSIFGNKTVRFVEECNNLYYDSSLNSTVLQYQLKCRRIHIDVNSFSFTGFPSQIMSDCKEVVLKSTKQNETNKVQETMTNFINTFSNLEGFEIEQFDNVDIAMVQSINKSNFKLFINKVDFPRHNDNTNSLFYEGGYATLINLRTGETTHLFIKKFISEIRNCNKMEATSSITVIKNLQNISCLECKIIDPCIMKELEIKEYTKYLIQKSKSEFDEDYAIIVKNSKISKLTIVDLDFLDLAKAYFSCKTIDVTIKSVTMNTLGFIEECLESISENIKVNLNLTPKDNDELIMSGIDKLCCLYKESTLSSLNLSNSDSSQTENIAEFHSISSIVSKENKIGVLSLKECYKIENEFDSINVDFETSRPKMILK